MIIIPIDPIERRYKTGKIGDVPRWEVVTTYCRWRWVTMCGKHWPRWPWRSLLLCDFKAQRSWSDCGQVNSRGAPWSSLHPSTPPLLDEEVNHTSSPQSFPQSSGSQEVSWELGNHSEGLRLCLIWTQRLWASYSLLGHSSLCSNLVILIFSSHSCVTALCMPVCDTCLQHSPAHGADLSSGL